MTIDYEIVCKRQCLISCHHEVVRVDVTRLAILSGAGALDLNDHAVIELYMVPANDNSVVVHAH